MKTKTELHQRIDDRCNTKILKDLAYTLSRDIIKKFEVRCTKEGSPLGDAGREAIRAFVKSKMKVVATVKVSMKELDALLPKGEL